MSVPYFSAFFIKIIDSIFYPNHIETKYWSQKNIFNENKTPTISETKSKQPGSVSSTRSFPRVKGRPLPVHFTVQRIHLAVDLGRIESASIIWQKTKLAQSLGGIRAYGLLPCMLKVSTILIETAEKVNTLKSQYDTTGKQTKLFLNEIQLWLDFL